MKNKLVIKSFVRKKSFLLYVILLVSLYAGLLVLNVLLSNLQETKRLNYANNSLATIHQNEDIIDSLKNNKLLTDVKRVVFFDSCDDYYDLIREVRVESKIIVIEDNKLNNDQADLYLKDYVLEEFKALDYNNHDLILNLKDDTYIFKINRINESAHINYISVSSEIFNDIMKKSNEYDYIFKLRDEEEKVKKDLVNIKMLTGVTDVKVAIANRISQQIRILIIFNIIVFILFISVLFVIAKNIIYDLNKSIALEIALGFNKNIIINNILVRLSVLNVLALIISFLVAMILLFVINLFYKLNVFLYNYYLILLLLGVILFNTIYITFKCKKRES